MSNSASTSLKACIRNIAKQKNIPAQVVLQNFMFERFLIRLSQSEYKDKFVLKGGMLISAIVGLDTRSTMDLDATIRDIHLTEETLLNALEIICTIPVDDKVAFKLRAMDPIRKDDPYGGFCVKLEAKYEKIVVPLSIDVSTGDAITPQAIRYSFREIFDETNSFELWTYNIETVLAEKVETVLNRGVFNTRTRDYYDIYILNKTQEFNPALFREALSATAAHRKSTASISDTKRIIETIESSEVLKRLWEKYQKQFYYASNISYNEVMQSLRSVLALD
ncbi:MAG: nucleotidyl transferase AbiEii/AbiGii toxin family protein [Raoultibacter sp.]